MFNLILLIIILCLNTVIELSPERSRVEVGERCPQALPGQLRTDQETRKGQRVLRKDGCGITGNYELKKLCRIVII